MTDYLISIQQPSSGEVPPPEVLEPIMTKLGALNDEMRAAGVWVFAGGLDYPSSSTVLRRQPDGSVLHTDGPYTEGTEYVGGLSIIRTAERAEALRWADRLAEVIGLPLEVRPFQDAGPAPAS